MDLEAIVQQHEARLSLVEGCVTEVGDAVLGTRPSEFAGGGRNRDGLRDVVAELATGQEQIIQQLASNGVSRAHLGLREQVLLLCAAIGAIGAVIAALVK